MWTRFSKGRSIVAKLTVAQETAKANIKFSLGCLQALRDDTYGNRLECSKQADSGNESAQRLELAINKLIFVLVDLGFDS